MLKAHPERHKLENIGWLRAAVLGANDGIVSTASLILGVAASNANQTSILIAGAAGVVAGAMSMATGEYISVQSQLDTEQAALETERKELQEAPVGELLELTQIYVARGLDETLAKQVAQKLMDHDPLGAHARDELGLTDAMSARPLQAAFTSALSFTVGALLPLFAAMLVPSGGLMIGVVAASLLFLAALGGLAAYTGGANLTAGIVRVTFWSSLSMAISVGIGSLLGTTI
jgi:VIT1/CCC1 family predicted Fe2+/Mn2+ transporter